jgi:hypothetical protein
VTAPPALRAVSGSGRQLEDANRALSAEVAERRLVQQQLSELNETLEQRVLDRAHILLEVSPQYQQDVSALSRLYVHGPPAR